MFDGPQPVCALRPCNFTIEHGEFVAITGPSGSGKTTLLSLLGLLDTPTGGRYTLDGLDVAGISDRQRTAIRARRIGFVFQAFYLVGYRSVLDNVQLGLLYHGVPKRQRMRAALEVVDRVGLASRRHGLCSQLSGGEKQRVAIARALVVQPAMMLCDEPTGNLDTASSEQVLTLIQELHDDGMTVVLISHDPAVAQRADRQFEMRDGTVTKSAVQGAIA